jgi:heme/copper-type cytochrome/quinol oxidase subunit 3
MSSITAFEEMHHLEPHVRSGRALAGVIMFIISDALSVLALIAAGGYLNALDTLRQFRAGGHPPALLPGLLTAIVLVLSGLAYYGWERGERKNPGAGQRAIFILAVVFMILTLAGQIWVGLTLGYAAPFHAYASLIMLLTWYSAFHFLLAAIIGILLLGRIMRGRLAEHPYIAQATGYWWYYTVIAGVIFWLFATFF